MGRHGVPVGVDGRDAALREARRPVRTQAGAAGRDRRVPDRLGALRDRAEHDRADRVPRAPGAGRRRPDGHDRRRRRRPRRAARPGPLPGALRRRVRDLDGDRPADRRVLRRPPLLAVDLLHQPPSRRCGAGGDRRRVPRPRRACPALDRLPRCGAAGGRPFLGRAFHESRRDDLRVGVGGDCDARDSRCRSARAFRDRRTACGRTDPAAGAVQEPNVRDHERDRLHRRARALRVGHLPAALLADRQRAQSYRVGVAPHADDARCLDHLDHEWQRDLEDGPLPSIPDRRHRCRRDRDLPAVTARGLDADLARRRLHAGARARPRHGDAGTRSRSAERRFVRAARRRHIRFDALPPDRRVDRRLHLRRDLRQPAGDGAPRPRAPRRPRPGRREPGGRPPAAGRCASAVHRVVHGRAPAGVSRRERIRGGRVPAHVAAA